MENGILNTLVDRKIASFGEAIDYENSTNYKFRFWKLIFTQPRTKSLIKNNTILGELNHPNEKYRDRDIDLVKVSQRFRNFRFIDSNGNLIAHIDDNTGEFIEDVDNIDEDKVSGDILADVDVLDTPMGRILNVYILSKTNIGFSTRANGTKRKERDGSMTPVTYLFLGIDAVWRPSKSDARVIDESSKELEYIDEESIENDLIELASDESNREDKEVIEEYFKKYGSERLKKRYFGDIVELPRKDLEDIYKKLNLKNDNLYSNIEKNKLVNLIYSLMFESDKNLKQGVMESSYESDDGIFVPEYRDKEDDYDELVESLEDEISDLKDEINQLEKEIKELKESKNNEAEIYFAYILSREFPNFKDHKKLGDEFKKSGLPLNYSNLNKVYSDLMFSNPYKASETSLVVGVTDEKDRIKKIIGGKRR